MATLEVRSNDRILLRALELFSSKGYEATSVREICEAAGITKPTLYHFYGSKEGVYRALVDGSLEAFHANLVRDLEASSRRGAAPARGARLFRERPPEPRADALHPFPDPQPGRLGAPTDFPRFYEEIVARIARCVDDGVARGSSSPERPTSACSSSWAPWASRCAATCCGQARPDAELADAIVASLLRGWGGNS